MEDLIHSAPLPDAGMCGCDREIFQRVWRRVMPQEPADSPIQIEEAAPQSPPAPPEPMPLVVPAARSPAAAAQTETPAVPAGHDVPCLGQASAVYAGLLREMIDAETDTRRLYQTMARRAGGGAAKLLGTLAADERRHARRLSTAYFLITGERYQPPGQGGSRPVPDLMNGLRAQFIQEQRESAAYLGAAEETADECLRQLYQELAEEEALHSRLIRNLLEQL